MIRIYHLIKTCIFDTKEFFKEAIEFGAFQSHNALKAKNIRNKLTLIKNVFQVCYMCGESCISFPLTFDEHFLHSLDNPEDPTLISNIYILAKLPEKFKTTYQNQS